jgi:transposase
MPDAVDPVQQLAELRALLVEREADLAVARAELTGARLRIEQYKAQLAKLRRMQFGRSSEKLDAQIRQLELMPEDLEEGEAARTAPAATREPDQPRRERPQPARRPLPDHLPREEIVHHPGSVCPGCGGTHFSKLGEDVTEVLEKAPARLKVIRHIRPKLSCRWCERIVQAPAPDLPIEKGRPGPDLASPRPRRAA